MFLYIIAIILFVLSLLSVRYENNPSISKWISKDNGDVLKGMSMIVIFLHHMVKYSYDKSIFTIIFGNIGFLGSTIFLFLSGYGLLYSYKNKKSYLNKFLQSRFLYIYLVFVICGIIEYSLGGFNNILNIFVRPNWFIIIILYYYLVFFLCYKFMGDNRKSLVIIFISCIVYIVSCVLLKLSPFWYNTAICFPMGLLFMEYKSVIFEYLNNKYYMKLIGLLFVFILLVGLNISGIISKLHFLQFVIPVFFAILISTILIRFNFKSYPLKLCSDLSIEIYLLHLIITDTLIIKTHIEASLGVLFGLAITLVLSEIINMFIKKVIKHDKRNVKQNN